MSVARARIYWRFDGTSDYFEKNPTTSVAQMAKVLNNKRLTVPWELVRDVHNEWLARKATAMGGLSPARVDAQHQARSVIPDLAPFNPPRVVVPAPSKLLGTAPKEEQKPTEPALAIVPPPAPRSNVGRKINKKTHNGMVLRVPKRSLVIGDPVQGGGVRLAVELECGHATIRGQASVEENDKLTCYLCTQQEKAAAAEREAEEKAQAKAAKHSELGAAFQLMVEQMRAAGLDVDAIVAAGKK